MTEIKELYLMQLRIAILAILLELGTLAIQFSDFLEKIVPSPHYSITSSLYDFISTIA
jgi:hypothetical protein